MMNNLQFPESDIIIFLNLDCINIDAIKIIYLKIYYSQIALNDVYLCIIL
jgi:hypothetical protein